MSDKRTFVELTLNTWQEFLGILENFTDRWVFRGQSSDYMITTSLERACNDYQISLSKAPGVEAQLIRDFKRRYSGDGRDIVLNDTLYCLALMQHHGAPTRLLDWTYSPFVAAFFALEKSVSSTSIVWCLNGDWCLKQAALIAGRDLIDARNTDETRNDKSFKPLYMRKKPFKMVFIENPYLFHERLIIQQGVFLCPGDISTKFEINIKSLDGWTKKSSIVKLRFQMAKQDHLRALMELQSMNVGNAVLFPGLDGFAQSLKQKLPLYERMARRGIGQKKAIISHSSGRGKTNR
jgi:hypothetical protein